MSFRPSLSAWRGQLLSHSEKGTPVHAGSFIRLRRIILERELLSNKNNYRRIFLHEVFHFAWVRLSNSARLSWEHLLFAESKGGARGELGWSSEQLRARLTPGDFPGRTRLWRAYACESFCDSGAWMYAKLRSHSEFTLAPRWRNRRAAWFVHQFPDRVILV